MSESLFWEKVNKTESCWVWTAGRGRGGYGVFCVARKNILAHRHSWQIFYGAIPQDMFVLHHCDNPPCVKPDHLFLGTQADNVIDRDKKKRQAKGEEHGQAKINKKQVENIRKMYSSGCWTQAALARLFRLGQPEISLIIKRKLWKP